MHDVFRTLRRLPSFLVKPFQRRYTRIKFLDLPDDIIYEISGHLSVRSLCNLSLTCHHLYFSLLFPHLRRLGLDDPFTQIHLDGQNTTDALPALRLLLFPSPIKTLSWKAGNDPRGLVREAEQLRRLVARIPSVEFLELDFSNNWPVSESRYGHSENSYWAWIRVCTNLLHVVAQKCHFVVITNHYQVLAPWLTFIGGKPYNLDDGLLSRICAEWKADLETKKVRLIRSPSKISLSSPPHAHSNETFSPPFPPSQSAPTTPGYTTARLIINDPGLFQRSLFGEWALKWVNMMPLTHLVIHQGRMRLPLLRQLRLPDLVHLTISRGQTEGDSHLPQENAGDGVGSRALDNDYGPVTRGKYSARTS
ncbi:hypothetical protein CC1G_06518 [Coprinopsis cinerea okayama7|uniref:F-box domain-containing protein n=1 Tax=Coprinopsis cinerea (strain Okayama-7 / 130 / ATCC MYA-4618 / FGSC 9003) TaxID=240176 RepID=A8NNE5_COPC7|nr:hypothetical protein CC1G_06518 [Coprinopsis cinerea okayama7\|eukprot:XP_001835115.2 hypothetical protein CC1G_06518 [Coprinopsis cinerea okayama7\